MLSSEQLLGHALQFGQCRITFRGLEPDGHPAGSSLFEPLQRLRVAGFTVDHDLYRTGVTSGRVGELIQGGAAALDLLGSGPRWHPAVAPGDYALENIPCRSTQEDRRMGRLKRLRERPHRWEIIEFSVIFGFFF